MAKRGRKPKMNNPYDVKDEAKHQTWQHGFNSSNKEDNPYTDQSDPGLSAIWLAGFKANKKNTKVKSPRPTLADAEKMDQEDAKSLAGDTVGTGLSMEPKSLEIDLTAVLQTVGTDLLEAELRKRKLQELNDLNRQKSEMIQKFHSLETRIQVLSILTGEQQ